MKISSGRCVTKDGNKTVHGITYHSDIEVPFNYVWGIDVVNLDYGLNKISKDTFERNFQIVEQKTTSGMGFGRQITFSEDIQKRLCHKNSNLLSYLLASGSYNRGITAKKNLFVEIDLCSRNVLFVVERYEGEKEVVYYGPFLEDAIIVFNNILQEMDEEN